MPRKKCPEEVKMEVIKAVEEQNKLMEQDAKEYGIQNKSSIQKWVAL